MLLAHPLSGDVACFEGCVEGGDPYRVTVAYRHATLGWHNVESGLRLDDNHPGLAQLHLLVRDGRSTPQPDPSVIAVMGSGTLTCPSVPLTHLGSMPLALFFDPDAIREHFEEDMDMSVFTDEQLAEVGMAALSDEALYDAFHDSLKWAMTTLDGEDPLQEGEDSYECTYSITSLVDNYAEPVAEGEILVRAFHPAGAMWTATEWVRENDPHFDERLDPRVNITGTTRKD